MFFLNIFFYYSKSQECILLLIFLSRNVLAQRDYFFSCLHIYNFFFTNIIMFVIIEKIGYSKLFLYFFTFFYQIMSANNF